MSAIYSPAPRHIIRLPAQTAGELRKETRGVVQIGQRNHLHRGIHAQFVSAAPFKTKLDGDAEKKFVEILRHHGADVIVLAGFMRVVKKGLLDAFPGKVINIHPSLLPAFPGLEAWKQALEYGAKVAGCTVHIVDAGVDTGPIIVQKSVPVLSDDTPEALHARIQEQEHIAYPEALAMIGAGSLRRDGRRIVIRCPA